MKTNTTNTPARNPETLLEWANTRRAQAANRIERLRERGQDITEATAAHDLALRDYSHCERAFLMSDSSVVPADTLERIDEAGYNLPEADESTIEGALQAAKNALTIAKSQRRDADTIALLEREARQLEIIYIRTSFRR